VNVIDIAFGFFILFLAIRGLIRGLIKEVFGLAALVGGILISDIAGKHLGAAIYKHLTVSSPVAYVSAFFIVFIVVYLVFLLIGYILSSFAKAIELGWLDRTLGLLFGAFKALLLVGVVAFIFGNFPLFSYLNSDLKKNSYIYSTVSQYLDRLDIQKYINRAKKIKNKEIKGITIIIGGRNAQG